MTSWFKGTETCRPAFEAKENPRLSYGLRFPEACAKHIKDDFGRSRAYIIASRSLSKNTDALDRLKAALGDRLAGFHIGISPHTPLEELADIIAKAREVKADCLVTLGAGSITDGAKIVRFAIANEKYTTDTIKSMRGGRPHNHILPEMPLVCIPTSLSGGEYQAIAGTTDPETKLKFILDPIRDPDLVIQDPELCKTTPERIWLGSGVRAVDHCVETLCSLHSTPEGDEWARRGLAKLIPGLLKCKETPDDSEARHTCQLGVVEAMRAVSCGVPLGGSHAIGHQLGPLGVSHGETSCIMLPAVCQYNARVPENKVKQAAITELLMQDADIVAKLGLTGKDASSISLSEVLDVLLRALGMPRTLHEVGIGRDKLKQLAQNSLHDQWIQTNPIPMVEESQVMEVLEMVV